MVPFIYEFLKRDLSDDVLEADLSLLSPQHLMEKVFRKQKLNTEQRSTLEWQVGKVDRCKNEFFPRRLTREYEVFPPEACFPFLKEIPIDDGRVSELWIDQEYVSFEDPCETGWYAKKSFELDLRGRRLELFEREVENLERIKHLQHPHLMGFHKAFVYDRVGVIISPLAKSDLKRELSKPLGRSNFGEFRTHDFWDQLLAISRALARLHDFNAPDAQRDRVLFGYHFDLKPANILVGNDGRFLIADFGVAFFLRPENGDYPDTSVAKGRGGDATYAPPENEGSSNAQGKRFEKSRKYDIWSLGCIFLEVLWYVVKGHRGSSDLSTLREQNGEDDHFWCLDQNGPQVKPNLEESTRKLVDVSMQGEDRNFISEIIKLIFGMLNPNPTLRYSVVDVVRELKSIIRSRGSSILEIGSGADIEARSSVTGDGNNQTSRHTMLQWNRDGDDDSGHLILQRSSDLLYGIFSDTTGQKTHRIGEIRNLFIVPFFALHRTSQLHFFPNSDIVIVPGSFGQEKPYTDQFQIPSHAGCLRVLGESLGQQILLHEELVSAMIQFPKRSEASAGPVGAVQIWKDCETNLLKEPTIRRLVVYFDKSILMIKFSSDSKLFETGEDRVLKWVPDGESRSHFHGRILKRSGERPGPAIPLNKSDLEQTNEKFSSISLTFKDKTVSAFFYNEYIYRKQEWRNDKHLHEEFRRGYLKEQRVRGLD